MKTRVISGLIAFILLIGIMMSGKIVFGACVFALTVIGVMEFYHAVSAVGYKPVKGIGILLCTPVILLTVSEYFHIIDTFSELSLVFHGFLLGVFLLMVLAFCLMVFWHHQYNVIDIGLTFFGPLYVVFLFSFVVLTRNFEHGAYYIWLVFIGAFATDIFAYFSGVFFGKTKLLPTISPKKTLEGSIGGVLGCMLMMVLYGMLINRWLSQGDAVQVPIYHFVVIGLLSGVISQIGDWGASAVKRYVKIKDYGKIMPGHGGVLDRFDSILYVAPVIYFYFRFIVM